MYQLYSSADYLARSTAKLVPEMNHEVRHISILHLSVESLQSILLEELPRMRWGGAWTGPAGISFTLLLTMLTAEFKQALFLDATQWQTVFGMLFLGSLVLLALAVRRSLKAPGVNDIMNRCRSGTTRLEGLWQQPGTRPNKEGSHLTDGLQSTDLPPSIFQPAPPSAE